MNLPNILSVSRIFLTFIFLFLITQPGLQFKIFATIVFAIASFTDYLDGSIARRKNTITNFGKIIDPIADKFLMLCAFFVFAQMQIIPVWMFMIIFVRECFITGWRLFEIRKGNVLCSEKLGKFKTVAQVFTIIVILIFVIYREGALGTAISPLWDQRITALMSFVVLITLISGIQVIWINRKSFHV